MTFNGRSFQITESYQGSITPAPQTSFSQYSSILQEFRVGFYLFDSSMGVDPKSVIRLISHREKQNRSNPKPSAQTTYSPFRQPTTYAANPKRPGHIDRQAKPTVHRRALASHCKVHRVIQARSLSRRTCTSRPEQQRDRRSNRHQPENRRDLPPRPHPPKNRSQNENAIGDRGDVQSNRNSQFLPLNASPSFNGQVLTGQ